MLSSEVTRWLDSFDNDDLFSSGDHANAWAPVWEEASAQPARPTDEQEEFAYYGS